MKPRSLVPDEVRAEHVKLSWQPPADDGGTPITSYLVRYMDIDTGEWVTSCTVSTDMFESFDPLAFVNITNIIVFVFNQRYVSTPRS